MLHDLLALYVPVAWLLFSLGSVLSVSSACAFKSTQPLHDLACGALISATVAALWPLVLPAFAWILPFWLVLVRQRRQERIQTAQDAETAAVAAATMEKIVASRQWPPKERGDSD